MPCINQIAAENFIFGPNSLILTHRSLEEIFLHSMPIKEHQIVPPRRRDRRLRSARRRRRCAATSTRRHVDGFLTARIRLAGGPLLPAYGRKTQGRSDDYQACAEAVLRRSAHVGFAASKIVPKNGMLTFCLSQALQGLRCGRRFRRSHRPREE